jgi:glutaredoxin
MKKVTWFYMNGCPYCRNAEQAYEAILEKHPEYKNLEIKN